MPVKIYTWSQRVFDRPNRPVVRPRSDPEMGPRTVDELSKLAPDLLTGTLRRAPAWTTSLALPAGIADVVGAFYDQANGRYCFLGEDSGDLVCAYTTNWSSWSAVSTIVAGLTLGGLMGRNVQYWGGYLWLITSDGDVYRGTSYTAALTQYYAGSDCVLIQPMNDLMWGALDDGTLVRQNAGDTDLGNYVSTLSDLDVVFMHPFRQYMLVAAYSLDDRIHLYRVPDFSAKGLHELAVLPTPAWAANLGCPFAMHDDKLYIMTAPVDDSGTDRRLQVYAFDGYRIQHAAVAHSIHDTTTQVAGLLTWNDRLLFYELDVDSRIENRFRALVGDQFVSYSPLLAVGGAGSVTPFADALGDNLILSTLLTVGLDYIFRAQKAALADGYVTTSKLDMGRPGSIKRLQSVSVLLTDSDSDFSIAIQHKINDASSWTYAGTITPGTQILTLDDLALTFYIIQFKVILKDNTSPDESLDIGLDAISCRYSIGR